MRYRIRTSKMSAITDLFELESFFYFTYSKKINAKKEENPKPAIIPVKGNPRS